MLQRPVQSTVKLHCSILVLIYAHLLPYELNSIRNLTAAARQEGQNEDQRTPTRTAPNSVLSRET
jgi:hypothetical protein